MNVLRDSPPYWELAKKELSSNDKTLADIIEKYDDLELISRGDIFFTLIRSIIGQQISVKAASTVWSKFTKEVGDIKPENILSTDIEKMRECGLSKRKTEYILGISESWSEYKNHDWNNMSDQEVIEELIKLRGVGKWTAEMILIFTLLRPDIFPIGDIGMIRGIEKSYNSGVKMSIEDLYALSENWKPWRTVACCFMWRTVDPEPVEY
tara:strand:+ start:7593 stop:8219 length:627 start_codon:yes stop_codon:yes gene_type:complete